MPQFQKILSENNERIELSMNGKNPTINVNGCRSLKKLCQAFC